LYSLSIFEVYMNSLKYLTKIENKKITAQYWASFPAQGPALLAWSSGTVIQPAHTSRRSTRARRGHRAVARPARAHRWIRCSALDGDSTGERWRLHRARRGSSVLTRDSRQRWGGENGSVRRRSEAAVELQWSGRASMRSCSWRRGQGR
jgi:hypothetical protein